MNSADFSSLVRSARSCRRFDESKPIPHKFLLELAELGRFVPSSRNQQALRFLIVSTPDKRAAIFPFIKWAAALKWTGPASGERATGYIFLLKPVGAQTSHDAGIVAQTIKLGAAAAGYASVMLGGLDRAGLHKTLQLPADLEIDIGIALGFPGEKVLIESLAPGQSLDYWHDDQGIHHVPKRPLEDLLLKTTCSD